MQRRGEGQEIGERRWGMATVHPSAVLRARINGSYDSAYAAFVADLVQIKHLPS